MWHSIEGNHAHFFRSEMHSYTLRQICKHLSDDTLKNKIQNGFRERRFIESLMTKNFEPNLNSQYKIKPLEIVL